MKYCFDEKKTHRIRVMYSAVELEISLKLCFSEEVGHVLEREEKLSVRSNHQLPVLHREEVESIYCHRISRIGLRHSRLLRNRLVIQRKASRAQHLPDQQPNETELFLRHCQRTSIGKNVSFLSSYWNRKHGPSRHLQLHRRRFLGSLNGADKRQVKHQFKSQNIQSDHNVVAITEKRHLCKPNLHLMASFSLLFSSVNNDIGFFYRSKNFKLNIQKFQM